MRFRKKSVVIEAWPVKQLLQEAAHNWDELPDVVKEYYDKGRFIFGGRSVVVQTLEGVMEAGMTDWIIKGDKGELYPCKDDIFRTTHERE